MRGASRPLLQILSPLPLPPLGRGRGAALPLRGRWDGARSRLPPLFPGVGRLARHGAALPYRRRKGSAGTSFFGKAVRGRGAERRALSRQRAPGSLTASAPPPGWLCLALPEAAAGGRSLSRSPRARPPACYNRRRLKKKKAYKTHTGTVENRGRGERKGLFTALASGGGEMGKCAVCVTNSC